MIKKTIILSIASFVLFSGYAQADIIEGPDLPNNLINWDNSGQRITALEDVILESFIFQNQGLADTIWLMDDLGSILETYNYSGGETSHFVDVSWNLYAEQSYLLIADNPSNGKWGYASYPVSNNHIQVDGAWNMNLRTSHWFNFNNIITAVAPEPVSSLLFLSGGGILAVRHYRKKRRAD